jgi:hypothetical protein
MQPFPFEPSRSSRAALAAAVISLLALVSIPAAAARSDTALSVRSVQPLTQGKPLVSGRLNTVPVSHPFGFTVSLQNARAGRAVLVKVTVRYKGNRQAPLVLKTTATVKRSTVTVPDALRGGGMVLFAIPARLTVSVTDRAAHVTSTQQYAVIFSLG